MEDFTINKTDKLIISSTDGTKSIRVAVTDNAEVTAEELKNLVEGRLEDYSINPNESNHAIGWIESSNWTLYSAVDLFRINDHVYVGNESETAIHIAEYINSHPDDYGVVASVEGNRINLVAIDQGSAGNTITLAALISGSMAVSGNTLIGGEDATHRSAVLKVDNTGAHITDAPEGSKLTTGGMGIDTLGGEVHAGKIYSDGNEVLNKTEGESIYQDMLEIKNEIDTKFLGHIEDTSVHLSVQDRIDFNHINSLFHSAIPEEVTNKPGEAIPNEWFANYFSRNAMPGMMIAPGKVYVSRVPYAKRNNMGGWDNIESAINEDVYGESTRKLLDNISKVHKCSTDETVGVDDYVGKEWAFYWNRGNYIKDKFGVKWVTAVEGETIGILDESGAVKYTSVFDPTKPTCVFGPAIWTFCQLDRGFNKNGISSTLLEDADVDFQLWGIGDRPWDELSTDRKSWLESHGITSDHYDLWSTAKVYDATSSTWKARSYIVESAYQGVPYIQPDGTTSISSIANLPLRNNLSHNSINNVLSNFGGGGARACALGIMFDIVKNATKNSQNIHYGMAQNNQNNVNAAANTLNPGYLYPIASKGNFEIGCTVYLRQVQSGNSTNTSYIRSITNQIGRIIDINNFDVEVITSDPTAEGTPTTETKNLLCLVIDPTTVQPFYTRTTADYAKALTDKGSYACAGAIQGIALAGETTFGGKNMTGVIGKHDGYISGTNGRHPYRVQGMEMMCGIYQCAADTVVIKGTGTEITLADGTKITPTSSQYVYLYAPSNIIHRQSGTLSQYISQGYVPVGVGTTSADYIFNGAVDTKWGVWYIKDTGASDQIGHADNSWMGASPVEYLSGGDLHIGSAAGSACLRLSSGLGIADWGFGARD